MPGGSFGQRWSPLAYNDKAILRFDEEGTLMTIYEDARFKFWQTFIPSIVSASVIQTSTTAPTTTKPAITTEFVWPTAPRTTTESPTTTPVIVGTLPSSTTPKLNQKTPNPVSAPFTPTSPPQKPTLSTIFIKNFTQNITEANLEHSHENITIMWIMVGLALIFFVLFLFTAGAWAVWNKAAYIPRVPQTRSNNRHRRHSQSASRMRSHVPKIVKQQIPRKESDKPTNYYTSNETVSAASARGRGGPVIPPRPPGPPPARPPSARSRR